MYGRRKEAVAVVEVERRWRWREAVAVAEVGRMKGGMEEARSV